ncbi:MAG: cation transporter [Candidatus Hydrogenedentes bacterium]|nr:cation transporter [Candidatus Hydrogenedentota bacterium]
MGASLLIACLMLVGKAIAYWLTGSSAILSDAAESVVHIAATGIAGWSLWFSRQAPCVKHPYGHGKIAYFSAGFEGALILSAALFIFYSSIRELLAGPELHQLSLGLAITGALALVNLLLGLFLVRVGRRRNALILVANGKHVLTDMWTSLAVVVGVGIVWATDIVWLDPAVAMLAAANILREAFRLLYRSFGGLIDEADPDKTQRLLACLDDAKAEGRVMGYHQLRHRQSSNVMWIELHVLVPGSVSTAEAHQAVTEVERRIRALFPAYLVQVTTHVEPVPHATAHPEGHPDMRDAYARAHPADRAGPETGPPASSSAGQ